MFEFYIYVINSAMFKSIKHSIKFYGFSFYANCPSFKILFSHSYRKRGEGEISYLIKIIRI